MSQVIGDRGRIIRICASSNILSFCSSCRYIVETEGPRGLFRGLGPNLVGVAPSRAIYFFTYSTAKRNLNASVPSGNRDTPFVHVLSAAAAGFSASTCTNPIWLVKTRLQLDRATGSRELTVKQCVQSIFRSHGFVGFWKGVTASYWGISETVIHFVIYESLKKKVLERQERRKRAQRQQQQEEGTTSSSSPDEAEKKDFVDFAGFMLCGACSKTCATIVAYPHGGILYFQNRACLFIVLLLPQRWPEPGFARRGTSTGPSGPRWPRWPGRRGGGGSTADWSHSS